MSQSSPETETVAKRLSQIADNMGGHHAPELRELAAALTAKLAQTPDLREALRFLVEETKWKSIDRDNMEFQGNVTCYQLDKARAALAQTSGALDRAGACAAAEVICDYTNNNLSMMEACDMDSTKAQELYEAAKRLRDMLAPSVSSTNRSSK